MHTTLKAIRKHSPCEQGWKKLLSNLNKTKADNEPLLLSTILESNGLDDAIWCLRAVEHKDKAIRLFSVECARQVQHLMTDQRSIDALDVAERFANGQATKEELEHAEAAAWDARGNLLYATGNAASAAARAAAQETDGFSARVARTAVWYAAIDTSWSTLWDAGWNAWDTHAEEQAILFLLMCEGAFD